MEPALVIWLVFVFITGAAVGSWLNVCIVRLPYEKSVLWPNSRCGNCFQPVRWYDNLPLISYWLLRGRCRRCGQPFSIRYFLIELFTGLLFVGLFYVEVVLNVMEVPPLRRAWAIQQGLIPIWAWLFFLGHAVLLSLLIVTTCTDLEHMEIPLSVTVTGTILGLILSACFPWPWPEDVGRLPIPRKGIPNDQPIPVVGWQPWPVWRPDHFPDWLTVGSWQSGLLNGVAGVLAALVLVRGIRFLFGVGRGVEGMGLGDADLMMMAGAFVGWQPVLIAFFVSVFPALVLGIVYMLVRGGQTLPFGPSLALGTLVTLLCWRWIGPHFQVVFFNKVLLLILAGGGAVFLLVISFILRLLRGVHTEPEGGSP